MAASSEVQAKAKIRMVTRATEVTKVTTGIVAAAAETEGMTGGDDRADWICPWP